MGLLEEAMIDHDVRALNPQIQSMLQSKGAEIGETQSKDEVFSRVTSGKQHSASAAVTRSTAARD